jgi:hypothetical protein
MKELFLQDLTENKEHFSSSNYDDEEECNTSYGYDINWYLLFIILLAILCIFLSLYYK